LLKNILFVYFLACGCCTLLKGQTGHVNVFPDQTGQTLLTTLISEFKTGTVLDYSIARDTLFSKIDVVSDSLECIYTGMKLYMLPGKDPTEAVYLNGIPNGINTEHMWPQGLGATGMAQSDMHHLYPSRTKANSDRGNFPFGEIADSQTQTWYLNSTERSSPPSVERDLYSEGIRGVNGKFEPRESVKGNIARSMFYFYTMYKSQADAEDPAYFNKMKTDLCNWHYQDPVDQVEWERNQKIATYQGGKLNPFVLDCSLVSRAYCNNIDQACEALLVGSTEIVSEMSESDFRIYPNPGSGRVYIHLNTERTGLFTIKVRDLLGREVMTARYDFVFGQNIAEVDMSGIVKGHYVISVCDEQGKVIFKPFLLLE
jgi:Endonuclease I/Secretion system C-terminal sorting domain